MSTNTPEQLEAVWDRFEATGWESTFSANQESFETFTLVQRDRLREDLLERIEGLDKASYKEVNTIMVIIGFGALREGARAWASFSDEEVDLARGSQIDFSWLWSTAVATSNPNSAKHIGFRMAIEKHEALDNLLSTCGISLFTTLMEKFPILKDHEQLCKQLLFTNLFHGVRLEYLFEILCQADKTQKQALGKLIFDKQRPDEAILRKVADRFGIRPKNNPWPKDLTCSCGASLIPAMTCCDPNDKIDPAELNEKLDTDLLFKRKCCGAQLTGFRCPQCGRINTWTKGIVDSF